MTTKFENMTKEELKAELDLAGVEYKDNARITTLVKLAEENIPVEKPNENTEVVDSKEEPVEVAESKEETNASTKETPVHLVDSVQTNAAETEAYFDHMNAIERG